MDKDSATFMSGANGNTTAGGVTPPSAVALRLLHLYQRVEDAIARAPDVRQGCRALLHVTCEALGAYAAWLHFRDSSAPDLVWPADAPDLPADLELTTRVIVTRQVVWSRPADDRTRLWIAVPVSARGQHKASLLFVLPQALDPDEALLSALTAIGLRTGAYIEREQVEEALRASEQRWATTLASIGDAVIATDVAGRVTFMNPVAQALTGWTWQEAAQRPVREVFNVVNEATREPVENPVTKVLETGRVFGLANHTFLVRKDGTDVAIDDSGAPIRDDEGRITGVVLVFRDISERRRAEEALRQSEERFGLILQGVADGILAQHADGRLVYVNHAAARMVGFASVEEMLNAAPRAVLDHFEILNEAGQPLAMDQLPGQVVLRTGRSATATIRFRARGIDEERWSIDKAVPVFNARGEVEMAVNIIQDITPLKRAEQALRAALSLTQELYASSREIGMANTIDELLHVLLCTHYLGDTSDALVTIYDHPWTADSGIPESIDVLATYTRPHMERKPLPVSRGMHLPAPSVMLGELQLRTRPWAVGDVTVEPRIGEENQAGLAVYGIRAFAVFPLIANGVNFGVIAFYFNSVKALSPEDVRHVQGLVDQIAVAISNQMVLQQEKHERQQAVRANELRLRFLGMISHELRTPMQSIKGFATTLLNPDVEWDREQQREFLQIIDQESDKLTDMIEQILDLSRIESGNLRINAQPQPFDAALIEAQPQLQLLAHQHALTFSIAQDLPQVMMDSQRIAQVLTNLVSNAAKYSAPGSAIRVAAEYQAAANVVRVSVQDEGPGIAADDLPHVFEAFRRGSDEHARQTKGAGLGLAICKGIVEAHGGRILIEEHAGPGAMVSFTLPAAG